MLCYCLYMYCITFLDNPLQFTSDDKMYIAFEVLTEKFLKEFRVNAKISDVIQWCERFCQLNELNTNFTVSSMDDLFQCIKKLPHHNFLNPRLLEFLGELSGNNILIQSVKNYEATFSSLNLRKLMQSMGAMIQKIKVLKEDENCSELVTKLQRKNVTISELDGFTVQLHQKILYLHTGAVLPQCIEEGCVCIRWIIPSCLVDYAFHAACLNMKMFIGLNMMHVTIGRYSVEPLNDSVISMY